MITKLIRTHKYKHKTKPKNKLKHRFRFEDQVIIIAGKYKNLVTKVLRQVGNYCFLQDIKQDNKCLQKAISRNNLQQINIKVHQSNIMHYDIQANKRSKVKYKYQHITNQNTNKPNKIRTRIYLKSGLEIPLLFRTKASIINNRSEENKPQDENSNS